MKPKCRHIMLAGKLCRAYAFSGLYGHGDSAKVRTTGMNFGESTEKQLGPILILHRTREFRRSARQFRGTQIFAAWM
jgi:hypothetical protein